MAISGAILSGGKNKRMNGRNKAFIEVEGQPIIERTIALFREIFDEILIVTNRIEEYDKYSDCFIVEDIIKERGPLGGVHAALEAAKNNAVFFVASDMPFLHNDIIVEEICRFNKDKWDALIPRIGDRIEPLHGIYSKSIKDDVRDYLMDGKEYSIRGFLKIINVGYFDLEDNPANRRVFENMNTPEDLKR